MRAEKVLRNLAEDFEAALKEVEDWAAAESERPQRDYMKLAELHGKVAAYRRCLKAVEDVIDEV
ncbi:hypothetical protein [Thermodesulfitimonas autotrophica]|uniref:hypothetical protein n=1 Tax=Thermodesulfitimonas autotrophica TaxID=1894989 RepID=UPI002FE16DDA